MKQEILKLQFIVIMVIIGCYNLNAQIKGKVELDKEDLFYENTLSASSINNSVTFKSSSSMAMVTSNALLPHNLLRMWESLQELKIIYLPIVFFKTFNICIDNHNSTRLNMVLFFNNKFVSLV